ncbi:MAG: VanZ family protein [Acidaminococcaceae bacterium]|nr:VanZ family protein [Acidaminococcaceae bacterium]
MRKFYWFAALAFTALIFYNSSLPAPDSNEMSYFFVKLVAGINSFLDKPMPLPAMNHIIRKTAHFTEYFIQALLICNAFQEGTIERKESHGYILLLSLMTAMFDEYIQLFSPGRSGQVTDIMLDFSGGVTGWLGFQLWKWMK